MTQHIAIIGSGYAGLAAGVYLAAHGYPITLFEANRVLGGRARAVYYQDQVLDNGQHICLGAYTNLLALIKQVGLEEADLFLRLPLELTLLPHFRVSLPRLPAPWHLLIGLWKAQGLSLSERWALLTLMYRLKLSDGQLSKDQTVASWLSQQGQSHHLISSFWTPLCLATLNTPLKEASAQIFIYVLRDSLGKRGMDSDLLLPKVDLSALFPHAAASYIQQQGGEIKIGRRIQSIQPSHGQWQVDEEIFDQAIIAVAPQQMTQFFLPTELKSTSSRLAQWPYQAIATVYLQYPSNISLPRPMQGIAQGVSQWIFDRGQTHNQAGLIAVVISSLHKKIEHDSLVQQIRQEFLQFFHITVPPIWYKVIIEKRATFSAVVNMERPIQQTGIPGLWLAGDYTTCHYPATIEGAVQSGKQVSQLIMEQKNG